jgi:TolB-like protein/DNA-binding winged helix-turn-helix (wHTH) protein/Tfp pilus assembly protein PilF
VATVPVKIQDLIRFGDGVELDTQSYKLRRAGRVLKLERIPLEILLLLVEQRGQIIAREQIVERVWGKGAFLDTDNSINGAIRKIRQVLKDDAEQPRFIQTITGQGYRFIAPVAEIGHEVGSELRPEVGHEVGQRPVAMEVDAPRTTAPAAPPTRLKRPWPIRVILAGALFVLLIAAGAGWIRSRSRSPQPPNGRLMLAVLPFQNLTGDSSQDYFSDGLTEEMITQLGNLDPKQLGVIARTSVMHYKNRSTPLEQIGGELGVQYLLEGGVRRDSDHVRITAQLIQVKDQTHLWARKYDRELSSLLVVQGEIAQEIADEIQLTLGDHRPQTPNAMSSLSPQVYQAYDLYLKGQYFLSKRTIAGFQQAIEYFQQATTKDPNYARAYAGLADSYALLTGYSAAPSARYMPQARAAALRALQIDDKLPEAHTALALIVQNYDWDWQTAEKEYRRAIELNPNYATAHHWYAEHLMWRGQFDAALGESERARQLDPLSLIIATDNGVILYNSRQYDRAIEKWRAVLEMDPDFGRAHLITAAYLEKGMFAEALADIESKRHPVGAPFCWALLAWVDGRLEREPQSQHALQELERFSRQQQIDPGILAWAYAGTGNKDQAFAWLEKAYDQHSNGLTALKVDPVYDPLRNDPRFQNLLQRVGLAQ